MVGHGRPRANVWYDVPTRRGKGAWKEDRPRRNDVFTKFFVSNLPERCSSADLVEVLKPFGEIEGTFIARKRDKLGKRFGFATFKNVRSLEQGMKNVWIGSYKLFIVLARFVDGEKVERSQAVGPEQGRKESRNEGGGINTTVSSGDEGEVRAGSGAVGKRTFRDTVLNKDSNDGVDIIQIDDNVQAFPNWYVNALVGS